MYDSRHAGLWAVPPERAEHRRLVTMTENNQTAEPVKLNSKLEPKKVRLIGQFEADAPDATQDKLDGAGLILKGKDQTYIGSDPVSFSGKVCQPLVDKAKGFAHAHLNHVGIKPTDENLAELNDGIKNEIQKLFQNKEKLAFAVKFTFEFDLATRTFTFNPTKGQVKKWAIIEELAGSEEASKLTYEKLIALI